MKSTVFFQLWEPNQQRDLPSKLNDDNGWRIAQNISENHEFNVPPQPPVIYCFVFHDFRLFPG
ncbi:hypothetical protein ACFLT9_14605, partial [Acidobacteriota bacterium]